MNATAIGRANTGLSAPMMRATAMLVYSNVMKNTHRLSPNSTPATKLARTSAHDGQRRVTAAITTSTAHAIHNLQNDSTTPDAPADLPSTPPNDQNSDAHSTATTPAPRVVGEPATRSSITVTAASRSR